MRELSYCGSTSCAGVAGILLIAGVLHVRELREWSFIARGINIFTLRSLGVAGVVDLQDMKNLTQMIDANLIKSLVLGEGLRPTPH